MFYLRAKEKDYNSTTPDVRKYYLDKNQKRLSVDVIDKLAENLHLWEVINGREPVESEPCSKNMEICKYVKFLIAYHPIQMSFGSIRCQYLYGTQR